MALRNHPSTSTSNITSVTAAPDQAFPAIFRREKGTPTIDVQGSGTGDGVDSFTSMPVGGGALPQQEKTLDKLAPMPENRRLGYLSVAALIINKMIGAWCGFE